MFNWLRKWIAEQKFFWNYPDYVTRDNWLKAKQEAAEAYENRNIIAEEKPND